MLVAIALALSASNVQAYEQCSGTNSYLESKLPKPATQIDTPLPRECVQAAHMGFPAKGVYGFCPTAKGRIKRDRVRPCNSEAYVSAVYSSIADVSACLGANPRLLFATLNLESGVHINAVGPAGDAGIGQLTKPAIEEVNRRQFEDAKDLVTKSNLAACRTILPHMVKLSSDVKNRCAFITVPDNPTRALIYSVLTIKQNRKHIEHYWDKLKPKISADLNIDRLKQHLTMLSYNAGPAGSVAVAAAFAKSRGAKLSDRDLNFRNTESHGIVEFISKHFPVKGKQAKWRGRIGHYVPAIISALGRTEARAGLACAESTTFPSLEKSFAPSDTPTTENQDLAADEADEKSVADNMKTLAEEFTPEVRGYDCHESQNEFLAKFLPSGASESDLPDYLLPAYRHLCDK